MDDEEPLDPTRLELLREESYMAVNELMIKFYKTEDE